MIIVGLPSISENDFREIQSLSVVHVINSILYFARHSKPNVSIMLMCEALPPTLWTPNPPGPRASRCTSLLDDFVARCQRQENGLKRCVASRAKPYLNIRREEEEKEEEEGGAGRGGKGSNTLDRRRVGG